MEIPLQEFSREFPRFSRSSSETVRLGEELCVVLEDVERTLEER